MLRGDDVADLQRRLNALGFDAGREDGMLGEDTHRALMEFQRSAGLASDGICGPTTIAALDRVGSFAEGSVATVREREHLRVAAARLAERKVFVAATPDLAALGESVARGLLDAGAESVLDTSGADDSVVVADANRFGADLFFAMRPARRRRHPVRVLRVGPLPLRSRVRGRHRRHPAARPRPPRRARHRGQGLRRAPRDRDARGRLRARARG